MTYSYNKDINLSLVFTETKDHMTKTQAIKVTTTADSITKQAKSISYYKRRNKILRQRLSQAELALNGYKVASQQLQASLSWRITSPLRDSKKILKAIWPLFRNNSLSVKVEEKQYSKVNNLDLEALSSNNRFTLKINKVTGGFIRLIIKL